LARARRTDPGAWERDLRGDLDWITLKAMAPERRHRYETARELAHDIERHLRSEPVSARPPSISYRAGRFVMRHRVGVVVAAAAALVSAAVAGQSVVQAGRLARERDRATMAASKARALNEFLEKTLLSPDPIDGLGRGATMPQVLDSAVARLTREPPSSREVEASVKSAIGYAYLKLGLYDRAEPLLTSALAAQGGASDSAALAQTALRVAQLYDKRAKYDTAAALFERSVRIRRIVSGPRSTELAAALVFAGGFARDRGDSARAVAQFTEAGDIFRAVGDSLGSASVDDELGVLEYGRGNLVEAERLMRRSLEYKRRKFGRHALVAGELSNLGALLEDLKRPSDAEAAYREAIDIGREKLGEDHDVVTATMNNLGLLLGNRRQYAEAAVWLRRALAADERKLGPDNPAVGTDALNLAQNICRAKPTQEGAALAKRAVTVFQHADPTSWALGQAHVVHGTCLTGLGRLDDAERELTSGLAVLVRVLGPSHRRVDSAKVRIAELAEARKR
jgi:tetratricopeptide (TPR) repeat protein